MSCCFGGKNKDGGVTNDDSSQVSSTKKQPEYSTKYMETDVRKRSKKDTKRGGAKVNSIYGYKPRILSQRSPEAQAPSVVNGEKNHALTDKDTQKESDGKINYTTVGLTYSDRSITELNGDSESSHSEPSSDSVVNQNTPLPQRGINDALPPETPSVDNDTDSVNNSINKTGSTKRRLYLKRGESRSSEGNDTSGSQEGLMVLREDTKPETASTVFKDLEEALF